ncbi:MAG: DCC1-like thiol-disulfide oxidoreductase family protein, partial [Candidatus Hodarchaeales archaeon]
QCLPFQSTNPEKLGFPSELYEKNLCYIREDGRKFTGARGFFEVVKVLPGFWGTVGRVLGRPILNALMEPIYRIVARNRFFLSNLFRLRPMINERKKSALFSTWKHHQDQPAFILN